MLISYRLYMLIPDLRYRYLYVGISSNRAEVNISIFKAILSLREGVIYFHF